MSSVVVLEKDIQLLKGGKPITVYPIVPCAERFKQGGQKMLVMELAPHSGRVIH
jgi:hypothetical protein